MHNANYAKSGFFYRESNEFCDFASGILITFLKISFNLLKLQKIQNLYTKRNIKRKNLTNFSGTLTGKKRFLKILWYLIFK
jgi:hypothetical protein